MELIILILTLALLGLYIVYKEWLNVAHEQWLSEIDLFKKRLAAYEQLKLAMAPVRASGAVSSADAERFARAMSDMRFLFDKDLERFVGDLYAALLKKQALDALLEKAAGRELAQTDKVVTKQALRKSRELFGQITTGVYQELPDRMEKFMRPRAMPQSSARKASLSSAPSAEAR
jgi:hypothetical protein